MRRALIITIASIIFILILLGITFLESLKNKGNKEIVVSVTPTTTRAQRVIRDPIISYDEVSSKKLLEIVESRPTPSLDSDKIARQQMIDQLGNKTGTINDAPNYKLEYVKAPNSFEAEIQTTEIQSAKKEILSYLLSRGLSEEGICKLPLVFYLNFEIAKQVEIDNIKFNPIPEFCL